MENNAFTIDSIQPHWLKKVNEHGEVNPDYLLQSLYFLTTRILASIIVGIALGCIISTPFSFISTSIIGGITIWIIAGIYKKTGDSNSTVKKMLFGMSMLFFLVLICGAFKGFTTPHIHEDMLNTTFSPTETYSGILLGVALAAIYTYRIINEKARGKYILPRAFFSFNLRHALQYGLTWGLMAGLIAGIVAFMVRRYFSESLFNKIWLTPVLKRIVGNWSGGPVVSWQMDVAIFCYGFFITFLVATIIIVLLSARYRDPVEENESDPNVENESEQQFKYGIIKALKYAGSHSAWVFGTVLILYWAVMFRLTPVSIYFAVKIALGVAILAFLWYGGMEFISHWILRLSLSIHGIAPIDYRSWTEQQKRMDLIVPTGYQLKFHHSTLEDFYVRMPMVSNHLIRVKKRVFTDRGYFISIVLVCLAAACYPFLFRYAMNGFWKGPREISAKFEHIQRRPDSLYMVDQSGAFQLSVSGHIHVGTFVGYVWPSGTAHGFMGAPMDSAYNLPDLNTFRHAALVMRIQKNGKWSGYRYAASIQNPLILAKGDLLEFVVNDRECENNFGHYEVSISLLPSDKTTKAQTQNHEY